MITKRNRYELRKQRTKKRILKGGSNKPRLSVFKSNKHIYAQLIDDTKGVTLASASSQDKELKGKVKSTKNVEVSKSIGELLGKRALEKGVKEVIFDRGGRAYHGRIKSLAEGARAAGLKF